MPSQTKAIDIGLNPISDLNHNNTYKACGLETRRDRIGRIQRMCSSLKSEET